MKQRIYLRALEPEDYKVSVQWRNDEEIQNMVGGHKYFVSSEREKQWVNSVINSNDKLVLAICLLDNDKYIGNVMLQDIDWINRSARVPVLIGDKSEWNKGYATEARMMMHKFAFEERNLERIYACILENNMPSIRMHEKCGYKTEGVLRNSVYKNGKYCNQVLMSILRDEFFVTYEKYCNEYK